VPLVSLNALKGRHWSSRARGKMQWAEALMVARARALAPPAPPAGRMVVEITRLMGKGEREYDFENLAGGNAKSLVDALTRLGFWRDDNPRYLTRAYAQRRATPDEVRERVRTLVLIRPEEG
jgi:Holliday junction resolvase RusA-like endonuclease